MNERGLIEDAIRRATGEAFSVRGQRSLGGGCINDAFRLEGETRHYFVKCNRLDFGPVVAAEAAALAELSATATARVPAVIARVDGEEQTYLILEYIETRASGAGDWESLGRQLAALHRQRQPYFGWSRDNWIGSTPQPNPRGDNWTDFFRQHRLSHQLDLCRSKGFILRDGDRLLEQVAGILDGHQPWPSLLHGDLWSGNAAFDAQGSPFLFDPASYYGDREADLAFTEFFGGFPDAFYDAYQESLPLDPGYQRRKILYNLYHCLNHVYLFGGGYGRQAEEMTRQLLA